MRLVTAAELGATWRPGCPVAPEQLRRVELDYVGFDGRTRRGALVVHEQLVADVIAIFGDLARHHCTPPAARSTSTRNPAVRAFTDRGWTWGGDWHNPIDYQHFEYR
jgi:hypothetical protein